VSKPAVTHLYGCEDPCSLWSTRSTPWPTFVALDSTVGLYQQVRSSRGRFDMYRTASTVRYFSPTKPLPWQSIPLPSFLLSQYVADKDVWCHWQLNRFRHDVCCVSTFRPQRRLATNKTDSLDEPVRNARQAISQSGGNATAGTTIEYGYDSNVEYDYVVVGSGAG
jgi:hypothetical protein